MAKRAIDIVLAHQWAITPEYMDIIASIAERDNEYHDNLKALEAKLGRPLGNTERTSIRDGVATIPVQGPLFRYANIMTEYSGATSFDMLAKDFTAALENPDVKAILLNIDSPGGEVKGTSEYASLVASARGKKPVYAFVGGTGASAAYWIASAADKVLTSDTAIIGSIGVMMGIRVAAPQDGEKSYTFISSNAKNKNAKPDTKEGAAQNQAIVDQLETVFIGTVAKNRGTTAEKVIESYGQGAVFVAAEALQRGMIDGISTYENVLQSLVQEITSVDFKSLTVANLTENRSDLVAAIEAAAIAKIDKPDVDKIRAEAAKTERERISAIQELAVAGAEELVAKAIADGTSVEAAAVQILRHTKANPPAAKPTASSAGADHLSHLRATEAQTTQPVAVATTSSEDPNSVESLADAIFNAK